MNPVFFAVTRARPGKPKLSMNHWSGSMFYFRPGPGEQISTQNRIFSIL